MQRSPCCYREFSHPYNCGLNLDLFMSLASVYSHFVETATFHLQRANMIMLLPYFNDQHYSISFSVCIVIDVIIFLAEELVMYVQFRGMQNEFIKRMGPNWKTRVKATLWCQVSQVLHFYKTYTEYGSNTLVLEHFSKMYPGEKYPLVIHLLNIINYSREIFRVAPFGFITISYNLPKLFVDNFLNPDWHTNPELKECMRIWLTYDLPFNDPQVANDCLIYKLLLPESVFTTVSININGMPHLCIGDVIWYGGTYAIMEAPVSSTSIAFCLLFFTEITSFELGSFKVEDLWQSIRTAEPHKYSPSYRPLIFEWATGINFNSGFTPESLLGGSDLGPNPPVPPGTGFGSKPNTPSGPKGKKGGSGPGSTSGVGNLSTLGRRGGKSPGIGGPAPTAEGQPALGGGELKSHAISIEDVSEDAVVDGATVTTLSTINNVYNTVAQAGGRIRGAAVILNSLNGLAQTALAVGNLAINNANSRGSSTIGGSISLPGLSMFRSERRRIMP